MIEGEDDGAGMEVRENVALGDVVGVGTDIVCPVVVDDIVGP